MLVVDAAHTAQPIIEAVGGRNVVAILCTHAHNDHVTGAPELGQQFEAPVLLHPDDEVLWKQTHLSVTIRRSRTISELPSRALRFE